MCAVATLTHPPHMPIYASRCVWGGYASQVGLPPTLVRRKMMFWVNHGLVSETRARAPAGGAGGSTGGAAIGGGTGLRPRMSSGGGAAAVLAVVTEQDVTYRRATQLEPELQGEARVRPAVHPCATPAS